MNDSLGSNAGNQPQLMNKEWSGASGRNKGIDSLRLLSMFYIVVFHVLGQGGILNNTVGATNGFAWLLKIIVYCAVDIYAIISGYVGYAEEQKPFKSSKYIVMWLQVFCYSFGITLIAFFLNPQLIGWKTLLKSFFPVATNQYWYFTAFTGVFLLKPWINCFIRRLSAKELTVFSVVIISVFSLYSTFASILRSDPFMLNGGYSLLWLILLYIVGACLKKCGAIGNSNRKFLFLVILACTAIMWVCKRYFSAVIGTGVLVSHVSPLVLFSAVAYVMIFAKVQFSENGSKIIMFFSPAAFGVYLIHVQPIVWEYLFKDAFVWICSRAIWQIPILVVCVSFLVFLVCLMIEKMRLFFFKLLRIDALVGALGNMLDRCLNSAKTIVECRLNVKD